MNTLNYNKLSTKQEEMIKEMKICDQDNQGNYDGFMNKIRIPKIFSSLNSHLTLNYEDYINTCKWKKAQTLKNVYNLNPFINPFMEITNNEILLYRHRLEKELEAGLHALLKIQFLDSLVILRKEECSQKLDFEMESLENITFLMNNLEKFFQLNSPTVANEIYHDERKKVTNGLNIDCTCKSPEEVRDIMMNIKLQSLSYALGKQHKCQIGNKDSCCKVTDHRLLGDTIVIK